jgi:Holliday junction resolvasome RuvABC endonuclease subunit
MVVKLMGLKVSAKSAHLILTSKPPKKKRKLREADDDIRRLEEIRVAFRGILGEACPDVVAFERVPRLRNPSATRNCALAWSAMWTICREAGLPVLVYDTDEIKVKVTGKKQASKAQMVKALKKIFPRFKGWPPTAGVEHVADAGGAALCAENDPAVEMLLRERARA